LSTAQNKKKVDNKKEMEMMREEPVG